jgi:hypothetical protein
MRRRVSLISTLLAFGFILPTCAAAPREFVYVWYPRNDDISGDRASSEYKVLQALLRLIPTRSYTVSAGDNPDYILRKLFLVSASKPHAYTLYLQRFYDLNPSLRQPRTLLLGQILRVPGGPRYGGTDLSSEPIPEGVFDQVFLRMSNKAYFGPTAPRSEARIKPKAVTSLRHFVLPDKRSFSTTSIEDAYSMIIDRGIVAPINRLLHPEETLAQAQTYNITVPEDGSQDHAFEDLKTNEKNGNLFPALVPADQSVVVPCQNCIKCSDILKLSPAQSMSAARLMIADTGIDNGVLADPSHLLLNGADGTGNDISPEHHGTFIYHQIAKSGAGPFSDSSLYVAKVARTDTGGLVAFSMDDIIKAQQAFGNKLRGSANIPNTWIVNLSAAGEPPVGTIPPPAPPFDPNILVIAAAGNSNSNVIPLNEAFGRLANGNTALLIVGSLDVTGQKATYSNYHRVNVQLLTRGDCVCGAPGQLNGTSQAAPVVAAAAAAVAVNRPQWYPREVMWRLITSADRTAASTTQALGGILNLTRALERGTVVTTTTDPQPLQTSSIVFNDDFGKAMVSAEQDDPRYPVLRLYDRSFDQAGQVCFSYIRYQSFDERSICQRATATVDLTTAAGVKRTISVADIVDIILPLPRERVGGTPAISVGS